MTNSRRHPAGYAFQAALIAALLAIGAGARPTTAGAAQERTSPRPATAAAPAAAAVSVHASLDRPAIFVADRVTYTIEIVCGKGYDILTDDLSRDKLKLTGLDMINTDMVRQVSGDETRYTFRYVLTTYRVDSQTLTIAPVPVRYFVRRPGMRPEEALPAGTVQVPGAAVARRSLLPDDQPTYAIRDGRAAASRPTLFAWMSPLGLGLLLLSAAPVVLLAINVGRRLYAQRGVIRPPSARQVRHALRERLEVVRQTDPADATARREGFVQLDALVREHLRAVSDLPAPSLTQREIVEELEPRGEKVRIDLVRSVLATCELAHYAPPDRLPTADAWRDTLADAEQVLATR